MDWFLALYQAPNFLPSVISSLKIADSRLTEAGLLYCSWSLIPFKTVLSS